MADEAELDDFVAGPGTTPRPVRSPSSPRVRRWAQIITPAAVGFAVFALAAISVVVQPDGHRLDPSPAERPGIPSLVRGVFGDGGLQLETDLAVGPASVAIANPSGAFVITAEDGVHHRLDLPGFDPRVYDDPRVRRAGMVGLTLSPDGTRLAYGWHAPLPDETGQAEGFVRSGLRILDLQTGRTEDVPESRTPPGEFDAAIGDFPWGLVPYGPRWSGDGRYLAYEQVWAAAPADGITVGHSGQGLDEAYRNKAFASGTSVYDTALGRRFDIRESRLDRSEFWLSGIWGMDAGPRMVADDGTVAHVSVNNTLDLAPLGGRVVEVGRLPGAPADDDHTVALFDGPGRAIVETRAPSSHLLAVDLRTGAHERLRLPLVPVHVDLLGWIGVDHALAQVRQGDEQNLIVFDLSDAEVETNLVAPFDDEGMQNSFSFATDFATVRHPSTDFTETSESGDGSAEPTTDVAEASESDDGTATGPDQAWLFAGLGIGILAVGLVVAALYRRIRTS